MAMAANTQTMGVRVSIRRTITPAKYTADTAYRTTAKENHVKITSTSCDCFTKDSLVCEVLHDKPHPSWEHAHQNVEVEEERCPGCRLML